jgi:lipopolysaccharide biosynthesis protein
MAVNFVQPAPACKAIAFHLPQFHPIPENDLWWGKGFTEWTNVTRAVPQFPGHWQPHLPADMGFYDLRVAEVREEQARLARRYGIHGFCYYHYWLHGKRLLELPVNEILRTGRPDFPFCLCWANHNWTRNWDDGTEALFIEQRYSMADHLDHIRWLCKVFLDERYIRIDGKPLFLIFRAQAIHYLRDMVDMWREQAKLLGVGELFLAEVEAQRVEERGDPRERGLDAVVEFQPDFHTLHDLDSQELSPELEKTRQRGHHVFTYNDMVERMRAKSVPSYPYFRCVTPSWDNTARRRSKGIIVHGSTPESYAGWLASVLREGNQAGTSEPMVFLNAWNEWAEGNHLEPCQRWGHRYLQATSRALRGIANQEGVAAAPNGQEVPNEAQEVAA